MITVHDLALLIHHDEAIRVTVECDTDVGARAPHQFLHTGGVESANLPIDVSAIGRNTAGDHVCS